MPSLQADAATRESRVRDPNDPLPPDSELAEMAKRVLVEIMLDPAKHETARVRAAQLLALSVREGEPVKVARLSAADLRELERLAGPELVGEVVPTERGNSGAIEPEPATNGPVSAAKE